MKKLLSLALVLAALLALAVPARAEGAGPFVELAAESGRLDDVIRLRNDGSEQDMFDDWIDLRVILAVSDLGLVKRNGPIYTTFESIYIAEAIAHDEDAAATYYGVETEVPFLFIRIAYTVENRGEEAVTMPKGSDYAWIVTNDGEISKCRIGVRSGKTVPGRIEPGESGSANLFFYCYDTLPDYFTFFSMFVGSPILDDGARYGPKLGLCFELLENAEEQAKAAP